MKFGQVLMCCLTSISKMFWLSAGDWKLVSGPFMVLLKWQYSEIWLFLIVDILLNCGQLTERVRHWIPNPGIPCSKPLGGSKVDSAFHLSEVAKFPGISKNLVVKSKLPPRSGCSLEAVETHPQKGTRKFKFFKRSPIFNCLLFTFSNK